MIVKIHMALNFSTQQFYYKKGIVLATFLNIYETCYTKK